MRASLCAGTHVSAVWGKCFITAHNHEHVLCGVLINRAPKGPVPTAACAAVLGYFMAGLKVIMLTRCARVLARAHWRVRNDLINRGGGFGRLLLAGNMCRAQQQPQQPQRIIAAPLNGLRFDRMARAEKGEAHRIYVHELCICCAYELMRSAYECIPCAYGLCAFSKK